MGVCASSGLPCPCVFQWGTRAARYAPKRTALDEAYNYSGEVIVVGAGAAGLAAARVLEDNKVRYTVLEATDVHGGRVKEDGTFADYPADLGAEWIHNRPSILDVLSGREGTAAETELVPYHLEDVRTWNGQRLKNGKWMTDLLWWFFPERKFKRSTWFSFVHRHFGEKVQEKIRFNSPVAEVDYSGERVKVTTASGEVLFADKILVTVSIGVLKSGSIAFVPELSRQKRDAIASVGFLPGFKMLLKFSEKFYPDCVICQEGFADGEKEFFDSAFKKGAKSNVLAFLITGAATEAYYALESEKDMVNAAIAELDKMFNGEASRTFTGEYRLEDWGRKEFTRGTWVEGFKLSKATVAALNAPLENKVYFAGEAHETSHQLGVPGAILSGLDSVDKLLGPAAST